jgi:hypothetical protein
MSQRAPCDYRVLDGNIHEFVLNEISLRAVDMIFDTASDLLEQDSTKPYPGLIDARIGSLPLNYMLKRAREVSQKYPKRVQARVALLGSTGMVTHSAMLLLRSILPIRLYKPSERDQALAWLRESQVSSQ